MNQVDTARLVELNANTNRTPAENAEKVKLEAKEASNPTTA